VFVELLALTDSDGGGVVREIDKDVGRTMPLKMFFGGDRLADYSSHFGREKELETIRNVIRHASTSFSRHNVLRGTSYSTPVGSQSQRTRSTERSWRSLSRSSSRSSSARHPVTYDDPGQKKLGESSSGTTSSVTTVSDGIHRITLSPPRDRGPRVHGMVVVGPQLRIVPLLYEGIPELQDILNLFDVSLDIPQERLTTRKLRARFQSG